MSEQGFTGECFVLAKDLRPTHLFSLDRSALIHLHCDFAPTLAIRLVSRAALAQSCRRHMLSNRQTQTLDIKRSNQHHALAYFTLQNLGFTSSFHPSSCPRPYTRTSFSANTAPALYPICHSTALRHSTRLAPTLANCSYTTSMSFNSTDMAPTVKLA